ncbi:MAG: HIT family protein [Butyrivibrio sp.]|nr:HIT family protein [Butyrivibrio sp.]
MKKEECIFCKLANGEIPTNSIYEDEKFNVILDAGPATKGHCLILPKDHAQDLYDLPEETAAEAMKLAKRLAGRLRERLNCDGLNVVQNNGATAGQTVLHYHLHLIPRYENDGQHILWQPTKPAPEELTALCKQLQ